MSGNGVNFFPCNGNANEQWAYSKGEFIGLGGNCLTTKSGLAVIEPCTGGAQQIWQIGIGSSGVTIQQGSSCLSWAYLGGTGDQLQVTTCSPHSYWVLQ